MYLDQNFLIFFLGNDKIRIYHTVTRRNYVTEISTLNVINLLASSVDLNLIKSKFADQRFEWVDVTVLSVWDCMLFNPDNWPADALERKSESLDIQQLLRKFEQGNLIHENKEAKYVFNKTNPFDRFKGSFHEQLGTEALFRKASLEDWWVSQKFVEGAEEIKPTPYRFVQEKFLLDYFRLNLSDKNVLDVGCGTGYWAGKIATFARQVTGIDYQNKFIDLAKKNSKHLQNTVFSRADILQDFSSDIVSRGPFDCIFMIDVFLYFFADEFQNALVKNRIDIMRRLKGQLSKDGRIVIMDPSMFWLIPRFGDNQFPFGILNEYTTRHFRSSPTMAEMCEVFDEAGLKIKRVWEPEPDKAYKDIDKREYSFTKQCPQWWVMELVS